MKKLSLFIAGLLVALSFGALAVTSGGFPSLPTFLGVKVGAGPNPVAQNSVAINSPATSLNAIPICTNGQASGSRCWSIRLGTGADMLLSPANDAGNATANVLDLLRNGAISQPIIDNGAASDTFLQINEQGTTRAYVGVAHTANGLCNGSAQGDLCLRSQGNKIRMSTDSGTSSFIIPKASFGQYNANSGGCSINAVWQSQNLGSCVRNSLGIYTVTFTTAYAGNPICVSGVTSATVGTASVNNATTTTVTVETTNTAFAPQDNGAFSVSCVGF